MYCLCQGCQKQILSVKVVTEGLFAAWLKKRKQKKQQSFVCLVTVFFCHQPNTSCIPANTVCKMPLRSMQACLSLTSEDVRC